jgi:hypothetical protein
MKDTIAALRDALIEDEQEYRKVSKEGGYNAQARAYRLLWRIKVFKNLAQVIEGLTVLNSIERPTPENAHLWLRDKPDDL